MPDDPDLFHQPRPKSLPPAVIARAMGRDDHPSIAAEDVKREGMDRAERGADKEWLDKYTSLARLFARHSVDNSPRGYLGYGDECKWFYTPREFTSSNIKTAMRILDIPEPTETRGIGAVMSRLAREGVIEACGFRKSGDKRDHNRTQTLWRGKRKGANDGD